MILDELFPKRRNRVTKEELIQGFNTLYGSQLDAKDEVENLIIQSKYEVT